MHTVIRWLSAVTAATRSTCATMMGLGVAAVISGQTPGAPKEPPQATPPTLEESIETSSRVPAPSELSCADPEDPCRLPNAFVADPPLKQVVGRSWEGGIRGRRDGLSWNVSAFRTGTSDDILFISSGPLTNTGHFENIGDTRRQGLELAASVRRGRFGGTWHTRSCLQRSPRR